MDLIKFHARILKKSFRACDMDQQQYFFSQIDERQKINLTNILSEHQQLKNIVDYYYLIEPISLLSEMKRMNYQSEDALLIMEKLEIDIAWDRRYDFKGQDENFNKLLTNK